MSAEPAPRVALFFDPDAYTEAHGRTGSASGPAGLMGRQVAGKEFLDAYLSHGVWDTLTAVVRAPDRAKPLVNLCSEHPSTRIRERRLAIRSERDFFADTTTGILHFPFPPDSRYAWVRQASRRAFAISGVTHTLSSRAATEMLCSMVTAPFEFFDALVCTSRAVAAMVRNVTGAYADYLADRFGGSPGLRSRLEVIPLGVNTNRFHPASDTDRRTERGRLGISDDEVVILCVGRLSHHAKAHPFPVLHAAEQSARRTGKKVTLVFAGWAAQPAIDRAYRDGAVQFAPSVRVLFADGLDPAIRAGAWHAADVFISLPDNIQETFGLVVVEAMASGLPVVGSDWDGYRDLIVDGETGHLVPTHMIHGATAGATMRLLLAPEKYDHFLGECSQTTVVDPVAAANALSRLVADVALRRRMGAAGRERAVRLFAWEHVIAAYEQLWRAQEREVRAWNPPPRPYPGPAAYPAPELTFAGYPTDWLADSSRLKASANAIELLPQFLDLPLTNLLADRRCHDREVLADLLGAAEPPRTIGELATELESRRVSPTVTRPTIAWLAKYGLLIPARDEPGMADAR